MAPHHTIEHDFDAAIALMPTGDGAYAGQTHAAYANMVGPFGGVTGATLLNAVMLEQARLGHPVALTVHFAAPIADGAFSVRVQALRTNRTTQHWSVVLTQDGQVVAFASAVTAIRRETWGATDAACPAVPAADDVATTKPFSRAAWLGRYELRFIDGTLGQPPHGEQPSESRLWLRDDPPRPLDFPSLSALCDVFLPRIMVRRQQWATIGTVALTTYFHADAALVAAQGSAPLLGVARGLHFGQGFFDQHAEVWSADSKLLASTHQLVYFRE